MPTRSRADRMQPQIEQNEEICRSIALSSGWAWVRPVRPRVKKCCPHRGQRWGSDTALAPFDGNVASQDAQRIVRSWNVTVIVGIEIVTVVEGCGTLVALEWMTRAGAAIVV